MLRLKFEHCITRSLVVLAVAFALGYHHRARADVFTPLLLQSSGYCASGAGIYQNLGSVCAAVSLPAGTGFQCTPGGWLYVGGSPWEDAPNTRCVLEFTWVNGGTRCTGSINDNCLHEPVNPTSYCVTPSYGSAYQDSSGYWHSGCRWPNQNTCPAGYVGPDANNYCTFDKSSFKEPDTPATCHPIVLATGNKSCERTWVVRSSRLIGPTGSATGCTRTTPQPSMCSDRTAICMWPNPPGRRRQQGCSSGRRTATWCCRYMSMSTRACRGLGGW